MAARRKEIVVKDAVALGLKDELTNKKIKLREMSLPPARPQGRKIEGDAATQAKTLVELLRNEAKVI
jgi:electron transfer flavoprotein beta subunit